MTAREGNWVVVYRDDENISLVKASDASELKVGKVRLRCGALVGLEFGATYEMVPHSEDDADTAVKNESRSAKHRRLIKYASLQRVATPEADALGLLDAEAEDRDNRDIYDAKAANQGLAQEHVMALRESGASGSAVVRSLVENSATYHQKTVFSQEKYVRRLASRHVPRFIMCAANARTVAEALFQKNPPTLLFDRLHGMRWFDTLPQMLACANVHASARVLCLDGTGGLLTLATAERIVDGCCVHVVTRAKDANSGFRVAQVDFLNLDRVVAARRVVYASMPDLASTLPGAPPRPVAAAVVADAEDDDDGETAAEAIASTPEPAAEGDVVVEEDEGEDAGETDAKRPKLVVESREARMLLRMARIEAKDGALRYIAEHGADGLLVASAHDCWEALDALLPYLGSGMPFAVHSPSVEPLMQCRARLQGRAMAVVVTESFSRELQVLPMRTHPLVSSSASGGFVLRGMKLAQREVTE